MNVKPTPQNMIGIARAPRAQAPVNPAPVDRLERSHASVGSVAAGVGGAVAGVVVGGLATAGVGQVGHLLGKTTIAMLPQGVGVPASVASLITSHPNLVVGVAGGALLLGLASAAVAGAGVAFHAGSGAQKIDDALVQPKRAGGGFHPLASFQEGGAEMRTQLAAVGSAPTFGAAAGAGLQAGASLGGPAGAAAGKVQGYVLGAAIGGMAGLSLATVSPWLALPSAVVGAFAGGRLGEAVGDVVGSAVAGGVGAASGAVYHAGQKIFHH